MTSHCPVIALSSRLSASGRRFILQELSKAGHPDIEPCHGDVFVVLFENDNIGLTELARLSSRSKSTISVMVRRLTTLGYLEKEDDQTDTRAVRIRLSEKGQKLRPVFEKISKNMQKILSKGFSNSDLENFEQLLSRALKNFDASLQ